MNKEPNLAIRIFEVVPRFAGELFRATKTPTVVILVAAFVVPLIIALAVALISAYSHSRVPIQIFMGAMLQIPLSTPGVRISPNLLNMLHQMTPRQLAMSIWLSNLLVVDSLVICFSLFWWTFKADRFVMGKWKSWRGGRDKL